MVLFGTNLVSNISTRFNARLALFKMQMSCRLNAHFNWGIHHKPQEDNTGEGQ